MDFKQSTSTIITDGFTRRSSKTSTDGFTRRSTIFFTRRSRIFSTHRSTIFSTLRSFTFAIVILLPLFVIAQQNYRITPDVVYGHKAGMALTYDVFQPVDSASGAGIIHIVSGSWNSRYMTPDSVLINYRPFLDQGYTVFALRHGSNPQFALPEIVDDVVLGSWNIHDNAYRFGVDSNRIGIFGGSSGGQLALMVGLSGEKHPVRAVVVFFPPADLRKTPDLIKSMIPALDFDTTLAAGVSPVTFASPDDPPTLLIHGDNDYVVATWQSERMYDSLQYHQVPSKLVIYKGMGHGNSYGAKGRYYEEATGEMLAWFRKYLFDQNNIEQ